MEQQQDQAQVKKKSWFTPDRVILLVAVGILGFFLYLRGCDNANYSKNEGINLLNSLQDTVKILKHKDSSSTATISVLETEKANTFLNVKTRDTQITKLQTIVNDYRSKLKAGNSATTALIETLAIERKKTGTIVYKDTVVYNDKLSYIYPEYRDTTNNEWISYDQRMNKDSSFLNLKIRNSFSAIVGTDKKRPFVDLTLDNPYSEVKELRTYQVKLPPPKRIGIGLQTGVTIGKGLKVLPYVGIGASYNIIRF